MKTNLHPFLLVLSGFAVLLAIAGSGRPGDPPATVGKGERLIRLPGPPAVKWSAAESALRDAMDADPSYSRSGGYHPQKAAIAHWRALLERVDLTPQQQVFAWWRIGSLSAYNFDSSHGEKADNQQAEEAFAKTREIMPGLVTVETLNSATVYGSLAGESMDRAHRLSDAFNWLAQRTNEDVDRSARKINRSGSILDKKFFPEIAHRESNFDERKQLLRQQLAEYQEIITKRISEEIQYSEDPAAVAELLKSIEKSADPKTMGRWREMHREIEKRGEEKNLGSTSGWSRGRIILVSLNGLFALVLAGYLIQKTRLKRR